MDTSARLDSGRKFQLFLPEQFDFPSPGTLSSGFVCCRFLVEGATGVEELVVFLGAGYRVDPAEVTQVTVLIFGQFFQPLLLGQVQLFSAKL